MKHYFQTDTPEFFKKGYVIRFTKDGTEYVVIRVYKDNWFKRFLRNKLKIKLKYNTVKIKTLNN